MTVDECSSSLLYTAPLAFPASHLARSRFARSFICCHAGNKTKDGLGFAARSCDGGDGGGQQVTGRQWCCLLFVWLVVPLLILFSYKSL